MAQADAAIFSSGDPGTEAAAEFQTAVLTSSPGVHPSSQNPWQTVNS